METQHLKLKGGHARITAVHGVEHSSHRGVAEWHFLCDLDWGGGKVTPRRPVAPYELSHDEPEGIAEAEKAFAALSRYLLAAGRWHEGVHKRDGRVVFWTPKKAEGYRPLK